MSAGIAVGSFVSGLVDGVDTRNRWDDRKTDNTRDEERFTWEKEDREWLKENRGWARDDRERAVARRNAAAAGGSSSTNFWADLANGFGAATGGAAGGGAAGSPGVAPEPSPAAAPTRAPAPTPTPSIGVGVIPSSAPADPRPPAAPTTAAAGPSAAPAPGPAAITSTKSPGGGTSPPPSGRAPMRTAAAQPAPGPAAPQNMPEHPRGVMDWIVPAAHADPGPAPQPPRAPLTRPAATLPETPQAQVAIPQQGGFGLPGLEAAPVPQNAPPPPAPAPSRWESASGPIGERGRRARNLTDDQNLITAADQGDGIAAALQAGTDIDGGPLAPGREAELQTAIGEIDRTINIYATTTNNGASNNYGLPDLNAERRAPPAAPPQPQPQPDRRERDGRVAAPPPAVPDSGAPMMPAPAPGIMTATPQARPEPTMPQPRTSPGMPGGQVPDVAASESPDRHWAMMERVMGVQQPPLTRPQSERVAKVTLDTYLADRAPAIIQHYLSKGQVDKATGFSEFIQSKEAQAGMASWARALNAASVGDDRGFVDAIEETYNATGYYDDGYELVRGKSGIDRDAAGNTTGATITLKDLKTGREFQQRFDDIADIYEHGVNVVSPEAVFEHGWGKIEAAQAQRAEIEKLALKEGLGRRDLDTIMKVSEHLSDTRQNYAYLTPAEQFQAALEFLRWAESGGGSGDAMSPAGQPGEDEDVPVLR